MTAPAFTPGPWFGPNYNSSTAEPTRALAGKFKPKGHKTRNDYLLRVEVSGDNVRADAALIAAAPRLYNALTQALGLIVEFGDLNGFRNLSDDELGGAVKAVAQEAGLALMEARGEQ